MKRAIKVRGWVCVAASACLIAAARTNTVPNVVLIMADDLGYEWLGCYGSDSGKTPALDGLAAVGARFNHCYSTPLCTPSRVEIMTGRYSCRNYAGFGNYPEGVMTFANILRDAGYATCAAGKWQLSVDPNEAGFDQYCLWRTLYDSEAEKIVYPKGGDGRYWIPKLIKNGKPVAVTTETYGPDLCTDFICDFIEASKDRPFLVYYPMMLTHSPFLPTPLDIGRDASVQEKTRKDTKNFAGMVHYMDQLVGRIRTTLSTCGVADNTLIIFTADNGTGRSITASLQGERYEGGKGRLTDNGTRVPLIAAWPAGGVEKGVAVDELVDFTDILPTLAEAAGVAVPSSVDEDGKSFLPVLRDPMVSRRAWTMSYFVDHRPAYSLGYWVRDRRWKLYNDGRLYNMEKDPREQNPETSPEHDPVRRKLENVFHEEGVTDEMLKEYLVRQQSAAPKDDGEE